MRYNQDKLILGSNINMTKQTKNKTTFIAVLMAMLLAIVGVGTAMYALTLESSENEDVQKTAHVHKGEDKQAAVASGEQAALAIVYGDDGFKNASYTVMSGETVLVKNESSVEFYFTTGDHHNHDIHSPLNLGVIAPGGSSSFVAPAAGTY